MSTEKRRAVVSFENMSEELAAAFSEKYPKGYADYFHDLVKYDKPNGDCFYAVTVEITDAIYLVKIKVKTDDAEDMAVPHRYTFFNLNLKFLDAGVFRIIRFDRYILEHIA